jgi:starch-binding outer membrane protein, SusD/RagB family
MKKLNYIMVFALILVLGACAKLKEEPKGLLSPSAFFNTPADGQAAIMGAYAYMENYDDWGSTVILAVGSQDDQQKTINASYWQHDKILLLSPTESYVVSQWRVMYAQIGAANTAISGIKTIPTAKITDAARNALIAEATVIRAFNYFRLVRLYGAVPYIDYAITDPLSVKTITKMPTADIYTHIIADLEASKDLLPDSWDAGTTPIRSRISRAAAYTILADVYLTRQNWAKAAEMSEYVISHKADFGLDLLPDFGKVFDFYSGKDNIEYIWTVPFSSKDDGGVSYPIGRDQDCMLTGLQYWNDWPWDGWETACASAQSIRDWQKNDYRRKVSVWEDAPGGDGVYHHFNDAVHGFPNGLPAIAKLIRSFRGKPTNAAGYGKDKAWQTDMNWPIYRYAEVLLIAAEAEIQSGNTANALTYINQVRARARNTFDDLTGVSTGISAIPADFTSLNQDSVLLERKRELAFEWKRWYDITRTINTTDKSLSTIFGPTGTDPLENSAQIDNSYKYWPIPQVEVDQNPNLSLIVP